ncbi:MAG: hypothetical protein KKD44_09595 [Proteobacteria bacterium]|nr:hypothetical protein [Pseudomonadota bacterium]
MTKEKLFEIIKNDQLFWSYNVGCAEDISDDLLIEHILIYSDVDVIKALFSVYDHQRIRLVWEQRIITDNRYKRLNVYLGRIFFNIEEIGAFIHEKNAAHSRYDKLKRLDT